MKLLDLSVERNDLYRLVYLLEWSVNNTLLRIYLMMAKHEFHNGSHCSSETIVISIPRRKRRLLQCCIRDIVHVLCINFPGLIF